MCGIVAYTGTKPAVEVLINGLKRLEYRGYDSAGVALLGDELQVHKKAGRVGDLATSLPYESLTSFTTGIGHTRWATHGEPSDINAHPHVSVNKDVTLVHNGIIENHSVLREALKKEGISCQSGTDTEVLVHLVAYYHEKHPLAESVSRALAHVEGTYGIVVLSAREPGVLVAARQGSPLILGIGDDEMILASDASAIVEYTRRVLYLDDGEMLEVRADGYRTYDLQQNSIEKAEEAIDWDIESIEKQGYPHFMLKEIHEQAETIANAFRGRIMPEEGKVRLDGLNLSTEDIREIERIVFIACGTSWHAGLIGEYLIEEFARIPVEVEYASEFRYRKPILNPRDLVFTISQSGETADTLAALREAKARGVRVMGITNVVGSTIARESDGGIYIHAGPEIGVASTKAFTSQITVLIQLAILLARHRDMSAGEATRILKDLEGISHHVDHILTENDIESIAREYSESRNFLYLGRGIQFPVALEGALKLKEISYIHAEGYPAAEMKHGPIALIDEDMPVVFIAIQDEVYSKVLSNMEEVKARKGRIIAIATEGDTEIYKYADHVIHVPAVHPSVSPLLTVLPLQLLSYHIAVMRECNVDMPRNLAKSVTVE